MGNVKKMNIKRRIYSVVSCMVLLSSSVLIGLTITIPMAEAGALNHTNGALDISYLSDIGRVLLGLNWALPQTARDTNAFGYMGLVIDHDGYVHPPGVTDIADCYATTNPPFQPSYGQTDDFKTVPGGEIKLVVDDGTLQKSIASFRNEGTASPYDVYINQTAWTLVNKDWVIMQWHVTNIKSPAAPLTNFKLGYEIPFSQNGSLYGVGGKIADGGDDIDGFDSTNNIYWVRDDTGIEMGVASAITSEPINHYFGQDYHADFQTQYRYFFSNETWLYDRISAPNTLATDGITPGNITTTVGWNGLTLGPGASKTFTMIFAINNTHGGVLNAIADAQYYFNNQATRFLITEISDSEGGQAKIEVFNQGRPATDVGTLSLSADIGPLTGSWSINPIPTYGYSVITVNENIDFQGDTIVLYQNSNPMDSVSYGQRGTAPDPLAGESTARYFDPDLMAYGDSWLNNASSGPSWGYENDVPKVSSGSSFMINEIMFNPSAPQGSFIELINTHSLSSINLRNFQLVCNERYRFPNVDIWLGPKEKFQLRYTDAQTFFDGMISSGDNVYLYNNNDNLYDMMGWSTAHLLGMTALRVPDGFGTYQGYDDTSSEDAGWVFNTPNKVLITEISDSGSATSQIEVYNPKYPFIEFNSGFTLSSLSSGPLTGIWSQPSANSGGYGIFDVSLPFGLDDDGDVVGLYQNGILVEEIYYGTKGTVPDPLSDESVQRIWTGNSYTNIWERNWTTGPDFGFENNVPMSNLSTAIVINEVVFNPSVPQNHFVELFFRFKLPVDISGFKIVGDSEYIVPPGTFLSTDNPFFYLLYSDAPGFFDPDMDPNGDNIYLYDSNGSILDMVGWNSPHFLDKSVCRVPDGNGTSDGYDDASSIMAEWQFDNNPTISLIEIDVPPNNKTAKFGDFGDWVVFNLTVHNFQKTWDNISFMISSLEGWPVEIMDETQTMIISNITLLSNEEANIVVRIKIPDFFNFIIEDNVTISIESSNNDMIRDVILLQAKLYPFLRLSKSASPTIINVKGTGIDEETTLTLSALGTGAVMEGEVSNSADIVFVVDDTGSMDPYLNSIKVEIQNIVAEFRKEIVSVRLGLISYKDDFHWDCRLTFNVSEFIDAVNLLQATAGDDWPEEIYGALNQAITTSGWRNESVTKIIILIGDAPDHDPPRVYPIVNKAKADVWGIYTNAIACGTDSQTVDTFKRIAENGSGIFYNYLGFMDPAALAQAIIDSVLTFVPKIDIAAKDLDILDSSPMIRDVLPPYIEYVPGSFSIPPDAIYKDIAGNTILEWNMSFIKIGENWNVTFNVTSTILGPQLTNVVASSRAYYSMWNGTNITALFPEVSIDVLGVPLPPKPSISVIAGTDHVQLDWVPPIMSGIDHYLIYRSLDSSTDFDFSTPFVNTGTDFDPLGLDTFGPRTSWNFTNDVNASTEVYYCLRTVNNQSQMSTTSFTVGMWTKSFPQGLSTFSIPLETLPMNASDARSNMGAKYISWMDPATKVWKKYGDGGLDDTQLVQGDGYEVFFDAPTNYTFYGKPAASIVHRFGGFSGFDYAIESQDISVFVEDSGNVTLVWVPPAFMTLGDFYLVFRSTTRTGFFDGSAQLLATIPYGSQLYTDVQTAQPGTRFYYMIIPENSLGEKGTSTYSVGVWTEGFLPGYDTFGLPFKQELIRTADWYCDEIQNTVGINYYLASESRWIWHSAPMPEGAYDDDIIITDGYQISISSQTKYTFTGF